LPVLLCRTLVRPRCPAAAPCSCKHGAVNGDDCSPLLPSQRSHYSDEETLKLPQPRICSLPFRKWWWALVARASKVPWFAVFPQCWYLARAANASPVWFCSTFRPPPSSTVPRPRARTLAKWMPILKSTFRCGIVPQATATPKQRSQKQGGPAHREQDRTWRELVRAKPRQACGHPRYVPVSP